MRNSTLFTLPIVAAMAIAAATCTPALAHTDTGSATATSKTALWKVTSAHRTLYITGSVMASLKKYPVPAVMTAAFEKSGGLILEGTPVHSKSEMQQLKAFIMQHGVQVKGHMLDDELTASQLTLVKKASAAAGMPFVAVQHFQPWWAASMLNAKRILASGVKPHQLYLHFYAAAKHAKMPISLLNTDIGELRLYAGLPRSVQINWLVRVAHQADNPYLTDKRAHRVQAWRRGDVKPCAAKAAMLHGKAPQFYRTMVISYEPRWLTTLESKLDHAGSPVFVIVQYPNLVGPVNLLSSLRKAGYQVSQL